MKGRGGPDVLVVDGDPFTAEKIRQNLKALGISMAEAPDTSAGLAMVHELKPPLILIDSDAPGRGGSDRLCRQIIQLDPTAKIILLSSRPYKPGSALPVEDESGALAKISKPPSLLVLSDLMKALLPEFPKSSTHLKTTPWLDSIQAKEEVSKEEERK
ncbi:response regulator [Fodinicurvata fenggangensis]|uniref:response regulator n=1 Tax=Fodinicurvata fenggangensis TaxID=1121830 RepID=UPI00138DFAF5|nr:response regulator [Fodinicurvata fenggangensis]